MIMDSLKVSGTSFVGMGAVFTDFLPYVLGLTIAIMNIIYLYLKIKRIKRIAGKK
jgi:hypothetical protein|tara:strand:+ start:250 stop:414 length:165 start_codon:yes stop_codon:yes gene_type:complete